MHQYNSPLDRAFGTSRFPDLGNGSTFVEQQRSFLGSQRAALVVNLDKLLSSCSVETELRFAAGPKPDFTGGSKGVAVVEFDMLSREHLVNLDERLYETVARALGVGVDRLLVKCPASWVREGRVTVGDPFIVSYTRSL